MNLIYLFCLFVFFPFASFAEEELSQFKVVRNNNIETSKVFETKDFFIIPPLNMPIKSYPNAKKSKNPQSYFKEIKTISKKEITKILKNIYAD